MDALERIEESKALADSMYVNGSLTERNELLEHLDAIAQEIKSMDERGQSQNGNIYDLREEIIEKKAKIAELEKNQVQLKLDKLKMIQDQGMERIFQLTKIVELEKALELMAADKSWRTAGHTDEVICRGIKQEFINEAREISEAERKEKK